MTIGNPHKVSSPDMFCKKLPGTSIRDVVRDGKELRFLLANNNSFNVHLMLNGKFYVCDHDGVEKINSKIAALFFEDGQALVTADYQGLCKITLNSKEAKAPDALSETFTFEYFLNVAKRSVYKNVKAVLIDQNIVRGIGNAYADEILWKADISPESVLGKIPEENLKDLFQAIPSVLTEAIETILKISPDIINGEERSFLKVHNSRRKFTDEGDKIIVKTVASKISYFTDKQKIFR